jgi:glycosyltransferase involved in cell wall biosynthesis
MTSTPESRADEFQMTGRATAPSYDPGSSSAPDVDILMTVYNGMPYIEEQIVSLQAQTHTNWRLWVRDDGSTDSTVETLRRFAAVDPRIRLLPADGMRLGAIAGFSAVIESAPVTADYILFCDADDVWLPRKIELSLRAMLRAEDEAGGRAVPILVHTDLRVVDRNLEPISESFWRYENIDPHGVKLNSLLVHNTVTGCAMMINAALMRLVPSIPHAAIAHDWWLALVAVCFGRIVPVPHILINYRQHGRNDTGAKPYHVGLAKLPSRLIRLFGRTVIVRSALRRLVAQASTFLNAYEEVLSPAQRELVTQFAQIPECGTFVRKYRLIRLGTLGNGWQRRARFVMFG